MADLKRSVIRDCLFGVDIEPEAIELAQLRLWLSLVLDLNPDEDPDPLPNLDFELLVGNSLIDSVDGVRLAPEHALREGETLQLGIGQPDRHIKRIVELKQEFFSTSDLPPEQREMRRQDIRREEMTALREYWNERAAECATRIDELGRYSAAQKGLSKRQEAELSRQVARASVYRNAADAVASGDYTTRPFVYELEFADIFEDQGGFDIVIANPPYVSVQNSSSLPYRKELGQRYVENLNGKERAWTDDLYVHFVFRAFELAKPGGVICFITSDTYFTIQSKRRMRELLHSKDLQIIAPCDPFKATVDAAVFFAFNRPRQAEPHCEFDQMRYVPDEEFDRLSEEPAWQDAAKVTVEGATYQVREWTETKLRRYRFDPCLWLGTQRMAIWEPSVRNCALYERLILPAEPLIEHWWDKIATNERVRKNGAEIKQFQAALRPGDIVILGLLVDGGQGLCLGDNARALAFIVSDETRDSVLQRLRKIATRIPIEVTPNDPIALSNTLSDYAAANPSHFRSVLKRGELYHAVALDDVTTHLSPEEQKNGALRNHTWVPYSKGNPEGVRWYRPIDLALRYDKEAVQRIRAHPSSRWQNPHMYFIEGVSVNNVGNHVPLKARWEPVSVPDQMNRKLYPIWPQISPLSLVALLNAPILSYVCKHFLNNTNHYNTGDIRALPIRIPDDQQLIELAGIAKDAIEATRRHQPTEGFVNAAEKVVQTTLRVQQFAPYEEF
jgi:hypothetical protein